MAIELKDVSYVYGAGTPMEVRALDHVSLTIPDGQFIGLIGHTGSGKSTLIQHLNGLIKATEGDILYNGDVYKRQMIDRRKTEFLGSLGNTSVGETQG